MGYSIGIYKRIAEPNDKTSKYQFKVAGEFKILATDKKDALRIRRLVQEALDNLDTELSVAVG